MSANGNFSSAIFFLLIYVYSPIPVLPSVNLHPPKKGKSQSFLYPEKQTAC
jgi:hypothetical protein